MNETTMEKENLIKACPHCGFEERDFTKNLRLGCPQRYSVFAAKITTFLHPLHRDGHHAGKLAYQGRLSLQARLQCELREVEQLISTAVGHGEADELLDRWKELSLELEASL